MYLADRIYAEAEHLNLSRKRTHAILVAPLIVSFVFALFLTIPQTRQFTKLMLSENHPVELLTFVALIVCSVMSVTLARQSSRNKERVLVPIFYGIFAFLTFMVAMEEIAWGQWFFGFETPAIMKDLNQQGEVTLHNLEGMHGRTEFMRLAFGLLGLVGLSLVNQPFFKNLTPSILLLPWFLLISITTIPDIWNDYTSNYTNFDALFDFLSELNEMLIGVACLLFVNMNATLLKKKWAN